MGYDPILAVLPTPQSRIGKADPGQIGWCPSTTRYHLGIDEESWLGRLFSVLGVGCGVTAGVSGYLAIA